jgi:O-antigen ligase
MKTFSAVYSLVTLAVTVSVMFESAKWATSIPEVMSLFLLAAWAVWFLFTREQPRFVIVLIPFAGILLWAGIQLALGTSVYNWATRLAMLYWAGNIAIFFCALQFLSDPEIRDRFLRVLLLFGLFTAIFSTVQALTSQGKIYWAIVTAYTPQPVFGPFLYRNQYAAFLELLIPVALYYALTRKRQKRLYFVVTAILYASMIACASRAGFVLATLELAIVPLIAFRRNRFSRAQLLNGALTLIGMLLWLAIPAGPDMLIKKLGTADPFAGRREFTESSLQMIKARPVMGFGLGTWATAYPGYALFDDGKFANQAHNDWAQWTVEGGLPLLGIMLCIAVWGFRNGIRTGWGLGIPIVFIHCCFDYPIQRPGVAVLFFLLLAAIAPTPRKEPVAG